MTFSEGLTQSALAGWHPALSFLYFVGALGACMVLANPVCVVLSFLGAAALTLSLRGVRAWRLIALTAVVVVAVALVSPLFNPQGATVLFKVLGVRPYTAEALALGVTTGMMLGAMLLWFASFHQVMTSEKITFLFAPVAPGFTLVLTMVLRFVPTFHRKADEIRNARVGMGKGRQNAETLRYRLGEAATVLNQLSSQVLEGAVATADSMESRGYGLGPRTHFSRFRWSLRDTVVGMGLGLCVIATVVLLGMWGLGLSYFPRVSFPSLTPAVAGGLVCYGAFLLAPTVANEGRRLAWRWSLSRM